MKSILASMSLLLGALVASSAFAQAPSAAPAGSTGSCKDGTYSSSPTKKGACSKHGGVKDWYAAAASAPSAAAPAPAAPAAAPVAASAPAPAETSAPTKTAAKGGGAGQVWVNTASNVYHCQGDRYYGKTKAGSYMTEAAAKAAGAHADHGKACS